MHLWILAFALLILFGTITIGHYSVNLLGEAGSHPELTRATTYTALAGLSLLVVLFCLYVLRILFLNRRTKSVLVEMNSVAASGTGSDDLLPSIAEKIAKASSVAACQMALLARERTALKIRAAYTVGDADSQPRVGNTLSLAELCVWKRVADSLEPIVLRRRDVTRLSPADREFLAGGLPNVRSILVVPMVSKDTILGVVTLADARGLLPRRFTASRIAVAQSLARHAASAIDQSRLQKQATRDPVTNLYIRRHFAERTKKEIAGADREDHIMVILLCDLHGLEDIVDSQGQQAGDAVLKTTAQSIRDSTRGADLAFRWRGNQVVVVLPKSSREGALIVASRIRQAVLETAGVSGLDFDVSIGIALYPEHGRSGDELIRVAYRALCIAEDRGVKIQLGEEDYALDRHSIGVEFQAVVDISSVQAVGYEALARDAQVKLSALELFEEYRATGRLNELKQIVFTSQITKARDIGLERVFINADFDVLSQLDPDSIPPGLDVVVELSERDVLRESERHLMVARKWREKGYKFAIDDLGAGLVSLPFLAMLAPEYVKVDRSTMLRAASSGQFKEFLGSLIQAVRTYATAGVIAEGIETREELQTVRDMGISLVQGSLLGDRQELQTATSTGVEIEI
jgi:diguanylate cyclase (GGDEF)-like protein